MNACLYTGRVSHSRTGPARHSFSYGITLVMLDVDAFDGAGESPLPARWRWLLPLRRSDHLRSLGPADAPMRRLLGRLVRERSGIVLDPCGSIRLLTGLGFLRHRFNPVSFYYCCDRSGALQCLVAEVTNTPWQEQTCYVLDAGDQAHASTLSFSCDKDLHVSPFMPMDTSYHWRLNRPGETLRITIAVERAARTLFSATLALGRRPLALRHLWAALARQPLMSLGVVLQIHWQALRLWFKAVPFHSHPRYSSGERQ